MFYSKADLEELKKSKVWRAVIEKLTQMESSLIGYLVDPKTTPDMSTVATYQAQIIIIRAVKDLEEILLGDLENDFAIKKHVKGKSEEED